MTPVDNHIMTVCVFNPNIEDKPEQDEGGLLQLLGEAIGTKADVVFVRNLGASALPLHEYSKRVSGVSLKSFMMTRNSVVLLNPERFAITHNISEMDITRNAMGAQVGIRSFKTFLKENETKKTFSFALSFLRIQGLRVDCKGSDLREALGLNDWHDTHKEIAEIDHLESGFAQSILDHITPSEQKKLLPEAPKKEEPHFHHGLKKILDNLFHHKHTEQSVPEVKAPVPTVDIDTIYCTIMMMHNGGAQHVYEVGQRFHFFQQSYLDRELCTSPMSYWTR